MSIATIERTHVWFEAPESSVVDTKVNLTNAEMILRSQFDEIFYKRVLSPDYVSEPKMARKVQIEIYKELGVPKELGLTDKEYEEICPEFSEQPEINKGRFNIQLLINPGIPARKLVEMKTGYYDLLNGNEVQDNKDIFVPHLPYVIWINSGLANRNRKAGEVINSLKEDEETPTIMEVVSLAIIHSEILSSHGLDILGTRVGKTAFAEIRRLPSKFGNYVLEYGPGWNDNQFGAPTRSKTIGIKSNAFYSQIRVQ